MNAVRRSRRGGTIVTVSTNGIAIQERGAWKKRTVASMTAADILDIDYSTRESAMTSARRAAEQRVRSSSGSDGSAPTVGPRTERMLTALSRLAHGRGITIKTKTDLRTFGQGLGDDEIRYLHGITRRPWQGREHTTTGHRLPATDYSAPRWRAPQRGMPRRP